MRFLAEHTFTAPARAVLGEMADPELYLHLELPGLGMPELLEAGADGAGATLRLRYAFTGRLDPIARRIAGSDRIAWVQSVRTDPARNSARIEFESEDADARLRGGADVSLSEEDGVTRRRIEGDVTLAVPVLRGRAERSIITGLLGRLDLEAVAISERLARR